MRIFVSRNIFHVHLNILICNSRILRQQKRTFEQIYTKIYETKTLTSTFNKHVAELLNLQPHVWSVTTTDRIWAQTSEPSTGSVQLKCEGTRSRMGRRKWRGRWRMEWVATTLHTTSEHSVSRITTADAHTSTASSRLNWRTRRFKWTRPFRRKTKSGFCACAITFQTQSAHGYLRLRIIIKK